MNSDETRTRCREMLTRVFLERIEGADADRSSLLGAELEEEIQRSCYNPEEYGKVFRSKYLNLKEPRNREFCASIYNGVIDVCSFIRMTGEQMKSQELRELEAKILERSIIDATVAKQEAETDIFFCNKCKQRKCSYRQLQTRSADEPMTTYVHCVVCGNNWKFC